MNCPKCKHDNPSGARFCMECGTKLELVCPQCGVKLPDEAKFCTQCGTKLTEASTPKISPPPPKLEDMQHRLYIPEPLRQKMYTSGREMEGETRLITALFADISGFTPASEELSPEGVADLANQCFKVIVDTICRYEGSPNRFIGDCVLAFFGAPIAHENDPERAILAALEMRQAITKLNRNISVGINTGMMYLGPIGTDLHLEYTAEGHEINIAKRLQEQAGAGQIFIGETSYKFTQRAFAFEKLPPLSLKGISRPAQAYSVLRVLEHPEKLRGLEGLRAKLIGREREFASLIDCLETLQNERKGQIVTIVGEAGIGKSRLVSELKAEVERRKAEKTEGARGQEGEEATKTEKTESAESTESESFSPPLPLPHSPPQSFLWLEGRCISIGQSVSFWPFIDIMRTYLDISGEDREKDIADKLVQKLTDLFQQEADGIIPYIGQMLSVKLDERYQARIRYASPEQIRRQTLLRMRDVFVALARRQPLTLILEDMHWADDLSLDLLWILMDELVAAPMMLVCVYRPEREHGSWQIDSVALSKHLERYTPINLKPLTKQESQQMVESLLNIENLPSATKSAILEKAEGNPFFVEEIVRWLIGRGIIYRDNGQWKAKEEIKELDVPDTVQSVILSRLDRLHEEVKYVLQCASVIGRVFRHRLLSYVSGQEKAMEGHLSQLEANELVYKERIVPELEYAFKHALTQETTYQGMLNRQRRAFHGRIGEGMESLYQGQIEEYYEQLAYHYSRSDNKEKAIEYLVKAGQKAATRYANQEALNYFQSALNLIGTGEDYDRVLGYKAKLLLGMYRGKEAASDYERLLNNAKQRGNRKQELESLLGLAAAYSIIALNEPDIATKSLELYNQAYVLARELDDKACMIRALVSPNWLLISFWHDYRDRVAANVEEALALSREIGDEELIIDSMMARLESTRMYLSLLEVEEQGLESTRMYLNLLEAEEQGEELLNQLKARHDLLRLKEVYWYLMWIHLFRANFARAIECCDAGIKLAEEVGAPPVQYPTIKAFAFLNLGRYDEAWNALQREVADEAHQFGRAMKDYGTGIYFLELMAYEKAAKIFEGVIEQARRLGRPRLRRSVQLQLVKSLLRVGQLDEANLGRITQDLESMGAVLPSDVMAEIHLSEGRLDEALQQAEKACSQAEEVSNRLTHIPALELKLRILLQLDRPQDMIALADVRIRMAEEMKYLPMLWRIRSAKAQALEMLGNTEAARQEYQAAAAIIRNLADTIPDEELKGAFMSNPLVSLVCSGDFSR